jgi:ABC-2 type transport system ATP-binding protein
MNILSGLIGFNSGEIVLDGRELKKNKRELLRKVGYLPQDPVFYGYMTAIEYLNFIGKINNMGEKEIKERAEKLLNTVGLSEAAKRKIGGYSGGMKQRFGIAVALFKNPEIVFLDEPTSALDPEGRMEVLEFIRSLKKEGMTVFLSTHILNDIERICDEVSILDKGEILISDNLENLKNKYIQPIFDIEFEYSPVDFKEKLRGISWINNTKAKDNRLSVYVNDLESAKVNLLKLIVNDFNPVVSFNIRKSNLEDIFIRLVNANGNI